MGRPLGYRNSAETRAKISRALMGRSFPKPRLSITMTGRLAEQANSWKGGRYLASYGYIMVYAPESPMRDSKGYVPEHRLVMSERLCRPLLQTELFYHVNQ